MEHRKSLQANVLLIGCVLASVLSNAQQAPNPIKDVSRWKTFTNRAGWTIKHPSNWRVGSCKSCFDPTDPNVFVTLHDPSTKEMIMIERLIDKPADQTVDQWLNKIKSTTNLNPTVDEEWISLDGTRALKLINRNPDSTKSENIYVVHGAETFAIRVGLDTTSNPNPICQQILSTFKFKAE